MSNELTADNALAPVIDRDRAAPGRAVFIACGAISLVIAALIFAFPLGVGGDYVNHLARTYIEGWIGSSEDLARYYDVAYGFIPDLTMDLTVPWLSHAVGIYWAGALIIALAVLSGPLAGVWLSRRLHGAAAGWLPLVGFATIFNLNFEFGFINFIASTGLALAAFTAWTLAAPDWRRSLLFAPAGLFLVANHALAFLLLGYLVLLWEIASFLEKERGGARAFLVGLATRDAIAFLPGLAFLAVSVFGASDLEIAAAASSAPWRAWDVVSLSPFRYFRDANSVTTASVSALFLYGGLVFGLGSGALRIDRRMAVVCGGLGLLVFSFPEHALGISCLNFRYPPSLTILLAASVRFAPGVEKAAAAAMGVGAAVLFAQIYNGATNMHRVNAAASEVRAGLAVLPAGARVLPVADPAADKRIAHYIPALSVIEADAYVPSLFTFTSPVDVAPAMRELHMPSGILTEEELIDGADKALPPSENGYWSKSYYYGWPDHFTHVLYMRAPGGAGLDSEWLCPLRAGPDFVLYRVKHNADCAAAG